MAEIKCPMCSKSNPADAEVCEFCGARLTPLVVDDEGVGPTDSQGGENEEVPGWLARIRERAEEEIPAEEPETGGPDWLSRLRSAETEEPGPPADEIPDWLSDEEVEEAEPEDDWLGRLRATTSGEEEALADEAEEEPEPADDLSPSPGDLSDRIGGQRTEAEDLEPVIDERDEVVDSEGTVEPESGGAPMEIEESEAWVDEQEEGLSEGEAWAEEAIEFDSESMDVSAFEPSSALDPQGDDQLPDDAADLLEGAADLDRPSWFEEFEEEAVDEELNWVPPSEQEPPTDEAAVGSTAETLEVEESAEGEPAPEEGDDGAAAWESFDWEDFDIGESEPQEEAAPARPFPEDSGEPTEEELPHVPALITGEGDDGIGDINADDFDLDAIELPDWLSDVHESDQGPQPAVTEVESGDLAPATIPSWLEAMRPVETFQPVVDLGSEEEQTVETVGPLAGLRGVLLAEPVVAKPHTSTSSGARLQVTERQYAQAELLRRIVEQEDQELGAVKGQRQPFPIVRWLISLVLVITVLLPPLLGAPHFATPERVSRDLGPLIQVVSNVPTDRPALVVFDYEPGYTAELSGVAGALLENLMARGVSIVTLSTRPTGPPLALDLLNEVGAPHNVENGRNFVHLGYLSGGPTAVQLFSAAPKAAILKGFMLPTDLEASTPWDLPVLRNVNALSDFGMVAVVAAGTDTARTWAEQAGPWMGDRPLVMVLSAGAEPLIRPYFESRDPQVDGILAGLPAAVAYEGINGRPGAALERWDSFGAGTLAVELILLAGLGYGVAGWVVNLRRKEEE